MVASEPVGLEEVLRALSDITRRRILAHLAAQPGLSTSQLATHVPKTASDEGVIDAAKKDHISWIAYPKAGQLGTDLNRDILWKQVSAHGIEGVRQIAIDVVWSAMRIRPKRGRGGGPPRSKGLGWGAGVHTRPPSSTATGSGSSRLRGSRSARPTATTRSAPTPSLIRTS